jgi:hypothetical protein
LIAEKKDGKYGFKRLERCQQEFSLMNARCYYDRGLKNVPNSVDLKQESICFTISNEILELENIQS